MNFLTVTEAADRLGIQRQSVHYLIKAGQLKAIWMLGRWAVPTEEVTRYKRIRNGRLKTAAATTT